MAFDVAAVVLPKDLSNAIATESLGALHEAIEKTDRTYLIFPERRSDEIKELLQSARKIYSLVLARTEDELDTELHQKGVTFASNRAEHVDAMKSICDTADENLCTLAKHRREELEFQVLYCRSVVECSRYCLCIGRYSWIGTP